MAKQSEIMKKRWQDPKFREHMLMKAEARRNYPKELYQSRTMKSWEMLKQRCNNPHNIEYHRYGGRGINYDKNWETFVGFYNDMGIRPEGMTLDRIDSNKGYSKENCKWSTPIEQANNTRRNRKLTINGETLNMSQWARLTGINPLLIRTRLKRGWSPEKAIIPYNG